MDDNTKIKFSQLLAKMSFIPLWGILAGILAIAYGWRSNYLKSVRVGTIGLVFNLIIAVIAGYLAHNNQQFASRLYPVVIVSLVLLCLYIVVGLIAGLMIKKHLKKS